MEKIHLCVGFYENGEFKTNAVKHSNLERNIEFNSIYRPGRYYFVDGEYVCGGMLIDSAKKQKIEEFKERLKELNLPQPMKDSAPYH